MSAMSIRLSESLHCNARAYAEREGVSVNQLIATALAEKLAALGAEDFLQQRAARSNRQQFEAALAQVPADTPMTGDELNSGTCKP
ncbi:MAG: toxin-antitoxin system HicB family antitoxin [Rhodoferax sp.]|nr:toxin-antitoxin system HicB family antitoxin [Rhodoferax sp.]